MLIGSLAALVVLVGGLSAWSAGVFDAPVPEAPLVSAAAPAQALRVTPPPPEVPVVAVDAVDAAGFILLMRLATSMNCSQSTRLIGMDLG